MTVPPPGAVPAAPLGRRAGAFAVDLAVASALGGVLIGVVVGIVAGVGPAWDPAGLAAFAVLAYLGIGLALFAWWLVYAAMQGGGGSIGQRLLGVRLRDAASGAPIGFWRALWRTVVFQLTAAILVGYATPLFDASGRRQGWHDQAARAVVVDTRADAAPRVTAEPSAAASIARFPVPPALPQPTAIAAALPQPAMAQPATVPAPVLPQPAMVEPLTPSHAPASPRPPATRPAVPVGTGIIDGVPWLTADPSGNPVMRASAQADAFPSMTLPFPAATTTEPLGAAAPASTALAPTALAPEERTILAPAPATVAAPVATGAASLPAPADDLDATRTVVPPPAQRAPLYDGAPVISVLTWDDGSRMAVYGRTLYGRNPAGEAGAVAIAVRDETLSLSKTHFEIGGDSATAWIVDRHSTNGTTLVRDGGRFPLAPGVRTTLRPGDALEFGDRRLTVGAP